MSTCSVCYGRGYVECPECNGEGRRWPKIMDHGVLRGLDPTCPECNGTGYVKCTWCDGEGYEDDGYED